MAEGDKQDDEREGTSAPLANSLARALVVILEKARQDEALAAALRLVATAILDQLNEAHPCPPDGADDPTAEAESPRAHGEDAWHGELASTEDIARLVEVFPRHRAAEGAAEDDDPEPVDFDPDLTVERLRLKAEASSWLAQHGYTLDKEEVARLNQLKDEGRKRQVFLWMLDPKILNPLASEKAVLLAANYRALEGALALWRRCEGEPEEADVVRVTAEAQAALRAAIMQARGGGDPLRAWSDPDQQAVFYELRAFAGHMGMYLPYLTLNELADPLAHAERQQRLEALSARVDGRRQEDKRRGQCLNRLRYHAARLHRGSHDAAHDVRCLDDTVGELVSLGLAESALVFDEPLRPILPHLADGRVSPVLQRVVRSIRGRERAAAELGERAPEVPDVPAPAVQALARLLRGKRIVMIGGQPRKDAIAKIERAFATEVSWLDSAPHQSHYDFKAVITSEPVGLVLLLIRWSSHGYAAVEAFCRAHNKPLVRVPGGYNVNGLANTIMAQVGRQLSDLVK